MKIRSFFAFASLFAFAALPLFADVTYYVDAKNGNDETGTGAEDSPKRSLAGVGALIAAQSPAQALTTVYVLPGNYGEDEGTDTTMKYEATDKSGNNSSRRCRVVLAGLSNKRKVRFVSTGGKEITHVVGKADSGAPAGKYGTGDDAIGGFHANNSLYAAFEGFTIRDCYAGTNSANNVDRGGAAAVVMLIDCVVSNCVAFRGGGLYGGVAYRCRFTANRALSASYGAATVSSSLSNCLIDRNVGSSPISYPYEMVNCTIVDHDSAYQVFNQVTGFHTNYNCLVVGNAHNGTASLSPGDTKRIDFKALVCGAGIGAYPAGTTDEDCRFDVSADGLFKSRETLDYRVMSGTDAVNAGRSEYVSVLKVPDWAGGDGNVYDFAGKRIDTTQERVQAGCHQEVVLRPPTVIIAADAADVSVEGGVIGENEIGDNPIVVTVKRTDRPVLGFALDGEIVTRATSVDLRDLGVKPGERKVLTAPYGTVWYVKQDGGDDGNTGAYPDLAKKTIRAAATHAVAGDTIRVYPGTYGDADGTMIQLTNIDSGTGAYLRSRVVVADGVTLESVEGAAVTSIVGASDPEPEDDYGSGSNAVRCVVLGANAVLRGFTITGGRTDISRRVNDKGGPVYDDNCEAAGILARGTRTATVEDCVVSNCASGRGAAGMYCRFVRTRILNCLGLDRPPAGRGCAYIGCLIDGCRGGTQCIEWFYGFDSCTIGTNNYANLDPSLTTKSTAFSYPNKGYPLMNSVILLNRIQLGSGMTSEDLQVSNCVFIAGGGSTDPQTVVPEEYRAYCTFLSKATDAGLAADYRPVIGVTTNAILDAVTPEFATDAFGTNDLTGAQRVMNGLQDVGALEGDWRPRYSKDIGRRATVTEASPDVVEQNGKVTIPGGSKVVFTLTNTAQDVCDYALNVAVEGGVLAVSVDGEPVTFESMSDIRLPIPTGTHAVSVALAGEATDVATIQSLRSQIGLMMILR